MNNKTEELNTSIDEDEDSIENSYNPVDDYPDEIINQQSHEAIGPFAIAGLFLITGIFSVGYSEIYEAFTSGINLSNVYILISPAIAAAAALLGLYQYLHRKKYGNSTLRISDRVGRIGSVLRATLRTSTEVKPKSDFRFTLKCDLHSEYKDSKGRDRIDVKTIWEGKKSVRSQGYSSKTGIPFEIEIPADCKQTGEINGKESIYWTLEVNASSKGINYSALFNIWVLNRD